MSKFKAGDKVRALKYYGWVDKGSIYTVSKCWYNSITGKHYVRLVEYLSRDAKHSYSVDYFELAQDDAVLTPEEVFEHLRKGTKLQCRLTSSSPWANCAGELEYTTITDMVNMVWRIKPEPEVIELNGKKYREIVE